LRQQTYIAFLLLRLAAVVVAHLDQLAQETRHQVAVVVVAGLVI
jgi:uncharacterized membrane protein YgcG